MKKLVLLIATLPFIIIAEKPDFSLYEDSYTDKTARNVGDLVTVLVQESSSSSKNEKTSTKKSAEAKAEIAKIATAGGDINSAIQQFLKVVPSYTLSGESKFDGGGSATSNESLTTQFTVQVVDKLKNGTLVIRGERTIIKGKEKIELVLTGLIRQRDINLANSIASTKIANARISYITSGNITKGTKPGWFWKLFQFVNPF